jgi:Na+/H+-dicarboxylate symporter
MAHDIIGFTLCGGIIVLWVADKVENLVYNLKSMLGETIDEAVTVVMKVVPKKKKHDELEV